jgi:hypothetical protein
MRRLGLVPVIVAALAAGALIVAPAAAVAIQVRSDIVLINQPYRSVCTGRTFTVGVWYQPSGGSRAYRVTVYNPHGVRIFHRSGRAPSAHWAFWKIRAKRIGKYRTVYSGHWKKRSAWSTYRTVTKAHRC